MKTTHIRGNARFAGDLKRYHGWPTIKEQSIAEHVGHIHRIYHELWGPPPSHVSTYITFHDHGELNGADMAHDVKYAIPGAKEMMDKIEVRGLSLLGIVLPQLQDWERMRFKACDLLEMAEFATTEQEMGNKLMIPVAMNIEWALWHLTRDMRMVEANQPLTDGQRVFDRVKIMNARIVDGGGWAVTLTLDGVDRR
jgi:hypothetical protein